jgi:ABC-type sugar transport system ATPase subunit
MTQIDFKDVVKQFGTTMVIKGLSLSIHRGEFFSFVGPSGCGKSTILKMIAGLEDLSEGEITFDGNCVNRLSPRDRDVAMVFQSYALYPHMRVYDNIAFPLKMKKVSGEDIPAEVKRVSALLKIEALLERKPKELSGGERQRVALARAIIRRPRVFLMDEPLSNLDAKLRVRMRVELKRLHQEIGITTIYVTHDQEEAMSLSDRIAVLYRGEVQQYGTPEEVYGKSINMFVAGFIGSPPMNFIPVKVLKKTPLEVEVNGARFAPGIRETPKGDAAFLGIRPEDVLVSNKTGEYKARVDLVEYSGGGYWINLDWQGVKLKGFSRLNLTTSCGENVFFHIPADRCHFFDAQGQKRLS